MSLDLLAPENFPEERNPNYVTIVPRRYGQSEAKIAGFSRKFFGTLLLIVGVILLIIVGILWTNKKLSHWWAAWLFIGASIGAITLILGIYFNYDKLGFFLSLLGLLIIVSNVFLIVSTFSDNGLIWLFLFGQVCVSILLIARWMNILFMFGLLVSVAIIGVVTYYRLK